MTKQAAPLLFSILPALLIGCQDGSSSPEDTTGVHGGIDGTVLPVSSTSAGVLSSEVEWASLDLSHSIGSGAGVEPIDEPLIDLMLSTVLQCSTEQMNYRFLPTSIRVSLARAIRYSEDGFLDAELVTTYSYLDGPVHPNPHSAFDVESLETDGVAGGVWNDQTIELWMEAPDTSGTTGFGMVLTRDEQVPGILYRGIALVNGCAGFEMTCWDQDIEPEFLYDVENAACLNEEGETGTNPWPIHMVRETTDGECANLSGVSLNEEDFSYPVLRDWNLQGAVLDGAELFFAHLMDAELEGADMSELDFGYAEITGSIDKHTQLPEESGCLNENDGDLFCRR
jgi:hypothetical protein